LEIKMRYRLLTFLLLCRLLTPATYAQTATLGVNAPQLYEKGMNSLMGIGVGRNDLSAVDYLRRSAELGYPPAQVVLGYFYDTGSIVSQDPQQAADWYKKAARQDDRLADWLLGRLYYVGGIPRDLNAAESWLQKAANQGDPFGQHLLGLIRLERNDYPKAADWFRKAAMQGLPQAQQQVGELFRHGQAGVTADKFEAYMWLLVSFEAGNRTVASELAALEGELGGNRADEAKSKARDLEQTVTRAVAARGCTGWPGEFNPIPTPPPPDVQRFCR
jgi:TPR repeat protein